MTSLTLTLDVVTSVGKGNSDGSDTERAVDTSAITVFSVSSISGSTNVVWGATCSEA